MSPNSNAWGEILDRCLSHHRKQQDQAPSGDLHRIKEHSSMTIEDVVLAIATIWAALMNQNAFSEPDVGFAFASTNLFDPGEFAAGVSGCGVVGGQNRFIMPLFFPPSEKAVFEYYNGLEAEAKSKANKEGKVDTKISGTRKPRTKAKRSGKCQMEEPLGHFVLAVAERNSPGSSVIRIAIRDSVGGSSDDKDMVRRKAQTLATTSGWMSLDEKASPHTRLPNSQGPTRFSFVDMTVPHQPVKSASCGLSAILSAWAVMLGIPIRQNTKRRHGKSNKDYLADALEIVNLALSGFMDTRTIQAWMNVYGYSERQDPADSEDHVNFQVTAVAMNSARWQETLYFSSVSG